MKRILSILMICLIAAAWLPSVSLAAAQPLLWISPTGEKTADAIAWYPSGSDYYFFLPPTYSVTDARFGFSDITALLFDFSAAPLAQGDSASFLRPGDYAVSVNGKSCVLHVMRGSPGIPALYITTESGSLANIHKSKKNKEAGQLIFVGPNGRIQYSGALEYIKCRGNSSMTFVKKSYQIKLESSTSLMGMGKSKKWILTGNYRDKSLLRNQIAFDLARYIRLPYTPEHISAELYINNEYQGVYFFSEKVMIDDDRVAIDDLEKETQALNTRTLSVYPMIGSKTSSRGRYKAYDIPNNPADITGGYLVEFEKYPVRYQQETSAYTTSNGAILVIKSPEYATKQQMLYVSSKLQAFENAINSRTGVDSATKQHYSDIVDMDSLVKKYLLEEFCKNYDGNSSSQFFFKPKDEVSTKFFAGPAWDYDSTFGSYAQEHNAKNVLSGTGLWIATGSEKKLWWPALYKQADFREQVVAVWHEEMAGAAEILLGIQPAPQNSPLRSLDEYSEAIRDSYEMNQIRWPRPARPSSVANTGNTLDANIEYLKTFISDRYAYLNTKWE